jgi:hypothetical protein
LEPNSFCPGKNCKVANPLSTAEFMIGENRFRDAIKQENIAWELIK